MTYWNGNGEFNRLYKKFANEPRKYDGRRRDTLRGEIFRAAMKIYLDYNNNALRNDTSAYASFLLVNVFDKITDKMHKRLEDEVVEFLKNHTGSDYGVEISPHNTTVMENMMSRVLVYIDDEVPADVLNTDDCSKYTSAHDFVRFDEEVDKTSEEDPWDMPEDDPYYQDEERLQDEL